MILVGPFLRRAEMLLNKTACELVIPGTDVIVLVDTVTTSQSEPHSLKITASTHRPMPPHPNSCDSSACISPPKPTLYRDS